MLAILPTISKKRKDNGVYKKGELYSQEGKQRFTRPNAQMNSFRGLKSLSKQLRDLKYIFIILRFGAREIVK